MMMKTRILPALFLSAFVLNASAAPSAEILLYQAAFQTSPAEQGWTYLTEPLGGASATADLRNDGLFWLDTSETIADKAGFFSNLPPFLPHPDAPDRLDRHEGFTVRISLQVAAEEHSSNDRAGFSLIVLTDDSFGIELGFWTDEVWAQTEAFQHAEGNAQLPFDHSTGPVLYELAIQDDGYVLSSEGATVLTGPLRDYSGFGVPYIIPNFIFFGDDTSSAAAEAGIGRLSVEVEAAPGADALVQWRQKYTPFEIDPDSTELTLAGTILGIPFEAQSEGSLTTRFEGTLQAALSEDEILFAPSSRIRAQNSGSWEPAADGVAGSAPANFAGSASSLLGRALAAVRDLEVAIHGAAMDQGDGRHDLSALEFSIPENSDTRVDYRIEGFIPAAGSRLLAGASTNGVALAAALSGPAGSETLTIPISTDFTFGLLSTDDLLLRLTGQLVARRVPVTGPAFTSLDVEGGAITLEGALPENGDLSIEFSDDLKTWRQVEGESTTEGNRFRWTAPNSGLKGFFRVQ